MRRANNGASKVREVSLGSIGDLRARGRAVVEIDGLESKACLRSETRCGPI